MFSEDFTAKGACAIIDWGAVSHCCCPIDRATPFTHHIAFDGWHDYYRSIEKKLEYSTILYDSWMQSNEARRNKNDPATEQAKFDKMVSLIYSLIHSFTHWLDSTTTRAMFYHEARWDWIISIGRWWPASNGRIPQNQTPTTSKHITNKQ